MKDTINKPENNSQIQIESHKQKQNIILTSLNRSFNVGLAGYFAMTFQVGSMMWLRTTMNYQFKNGGTTLDTIKLLYTQGGVPRFYRGVGFALINAPLSRFGDTAANMGMMTLLENSGYNDAQKTFMGSVCAGLWRLTIIPVDSFKSHLQVHGTRGMVILNKKIKMGGVRTLYNGAGASFGATVMGHFPWFMTYNYLQSKLPYKVRDENPPIVNFLRSGCIGFLSSTCSDVVTNSIRVIKIGRQTGDKNNYRDVIKEVVQKENVFGLMTRGLKTKIIINGLQGGVFVVIFDYLKGILN